MQKNIKLFLFLSLILSVNSYALKKNKKEVLSMILIEAFQQKIGAGNIPEGGEAKSFETINRRIIIQWNSPFTPEFIFWRSDKNVWQNMEVSRVHKPIVAPTSPFELGYLTEAVDLQEIKKGDSLELIPAKVSAAPETNAFLKLPTNAIYFYIRALKKWDYLLINQFTEKPEALRP